MRKNKKGSFLAINFTGILAVAAAFFGLIVFFGGASFEERNMARLIFPLALYALVCAVLSGRRAQFFDPERFETADPAGYREALKKLGEVPLKTLLLITLCSLAFLVPAVMLGSFLGIVPQMKTPIFLLGFSMALLGAAFVYVLSDRLVSRALSANSLVFYPRDLREGRQSLKVFIIPMAIAIISMVFTLGLSMLAVIKSGKTVTEMNAGDWAILVYLLVPFFIIEVCLASSIKNNSGVLYGTIIAQLENLSSAKKDLTRRIFICSVDELGTIAGMVNNFSENMEKGMREIKNSQRSLSDSGITLKEEASAMADSLSRLSGGVDDVRRQSESQMLSVNESSAAVEEIAKNIEALDSSITRQSSSVSQASSAVEEMVENIRSIGSMTDRMMSQFKTVTEAAGEGEKIQKESGERVAEIVAESEALQEANRIIAAIAAQTNLLAMNAAIEAAHAGDAGRGFAVVADEIRKLAETSSRESSKISSELKQISGTINNIVKGTGASTRAFEQVAARVGETEKLVYEVNNAIREQQEGVEQVLHALKVMNDITGEVSSGSKEMSKGNETMLSEMAKLQSGSRQISESIGKMAGGINRVSGGAQKASELAENNQTAIDGISCVVDEFEV